MPPPGKPPFDRSAPSWRNLPPQQFRLLRADRRQPQHQTTVSMLIVLLIARPAGGEKIFPRLPVAQRKAAAGCWVVLVSVSSQRSLSPFSRAASASRRYLLIVQAIQLMPVIDHQGRRFSAPAAAVELTCSGRFSVQRAQHRLLRWSIKRCPA